MITLDGLSKRLLADDELGFPVTRRILPLVAIERLAAHIAKDTNPGFNVEQLEEGILSGDLTGAVLFQLRRAIEAIEAERRNPTPHLKLVPPPKAKRRRRRKAGGDS